MRSISAAAVLWLRAAVALAPHAAAADDDCAGAAAQYVSLVDTKGLHIVCVETPRRPGLELVHVQVYRDSLEARLETTTLVRDEGDEDGESTVWPEVLLQHLTTTLHKRGYAAWRRRSHLSVALFRCPPPPPPPPPHHHPPQTGPCSASPRLPSAQHERAAGADERRILRRGRRTGPPIAICIRRRPVDVATRAP